MLSNALCLEVLRRSSLPSFSHHVTHKTCTVFLQLVQSYATFRDSLQERGVEDRSLLAVLLRVILSLHGFLTITMPYVLQEF